MLLMSRGPSAHTSVLPAVKQFLSLCPKSGKQEPPSDVTAGRKFRHLAPETLVLLVHREGWTLGGLGRTRKGQRFHFCVSDMES